MSATLSAAEREKKRKYSYAAQAWHASFSPFVVLVDGLLAQEARFTVQRFADRLSNKWSKPYSEVMGWLQTRPSFAILRATNQCVCGLRSGGVVSAWRWGRPRPDYKLDSACCLFSFFSLLLSLYICIYTCKRYILYHFCWLCTQDASSDILSFCFLLELWYIIKIASAHGPNGILPP